VGVSIAKTIPKSGEVDCEDALIAGLTAERATKAKAAARGKKAKKSLDEQLEALSTAIRDAGIGEEEREYVESDFEILCLELKKKKPVKQRILNQLKEMAYLKDLTDAAEELIETVRKAF
jgi:hypothetical protein